MDNNQKPNTKTITWTKTIPKWDNVGIKPTPSKIRDGWKTGEKPPCETVNFLQNSMGEAVEENRENIEKVAFDNGTTANYIGTPSSTEDRNTLFGFNKIIERAIILGKAVIDLIKTDTTNIRTTATSIKSETALIKADTTYIRNNLSVVKRITRGRVDRAVSTIALPTGTNTAKISITLVGELTAYYPSALDNVLLYNPYVTSVGSTAINFQRHRRYDNSGNFTTYYDTAYEIIEYY